MSEPSESSWTRRARPLLGTIVEVKADGPPATVEAAFAEIQRIQQQMSYHDPQSELSQLNRQAAKEWVAVSHDVMAVLKAALTLAAQTSGIFDPTVAARLTSLGFLPKVPGSPIANRLATWRDIEINDANRSIRFHRSLRIDLGGIAKGYAVDAAIQRLKNEGVAEGAVNAGGDLRVFGRKVQAIAIRHPENVGTIIASIPLQEAALATSAGTFKRRNRGGTEITALLDGRDRRPLSVSTSVSVIAPNTMDADALTKVALALGPAAENILSQYRATAFFFDSGGARFVPPLQNAA